ncbi:MAG: DNA recombination protein RmuC [Rickettsiales bacterium]
MEMLLPVVIFLSGAAAGFLVARKLLAGAAGDPQSAELKVKLAALEQEIRNYTTRIGALDMQKQTLEEKLGSQQEFVTQMQDQFQLKFENLANRIFEEKHQQSEKNLQKLLTPLKEDLSGFKKHISESFGSHAKEQFALKNEIANIVKVSNEMRFQTENLSKALRGDSKAQGNWGEVVLERILEAAGLRRDEEYVTQGTGLGLKHPEDGRTQKPDVVIKLPENKHAIIDAKVSLTAYERFCGEEDAAAKATHLAQFLQSVKAHVKGLEERRYQDTPGLDTPEYVLMFMPIEGAYSLAMQEDANLHAHAWERKIIIVCPSTLFAILKIIASMWKFERQNKNADEIAKRGGALYDKVAGFVSDMLSLGKKLDSAQETYGEALKKLSTGTGNVLRQAEQLRALGVKNSKAIPAAVLGEEADELVQITREDAA